MKKQYIKRYLYMWLLLLFITLPAAAQQKIFTGTITDKYGQPIVDAIVGIREQPGIRVFTDNEGKFSITGEVGQILEVRTGENRFNSLIIESDPVSLVIDEKDEMIPVGYRMEQRAEELTSAIGFVKAGELSKNPARNPANSLYGKIPGLTVLQNGGTNWNSNPDIYIRGVETFGIGTFVNTNILTLIDGFERPLSSISMAEIENVAILKDAAALAMFGIRGANGVMLITTKRGTSNGLAVDVNYEHGITQAFRLPEFLNASDYAAAVNQASINDGQPALYSQTELDNFRSGASPYLYPDVNWLGEGMRNNGFSDKFSISFQEQARAVKYYAVINYDREHGLLGPVEDNEGYSTQMTGRRFNLRTNITMDMTSTLKFTLNLAGNLGQTSRPGTAEGDLLSAMFNTPSAAFPVKTYNQNWGGTSTYDNNPIGLISGTGYTNVGTRELMTDFVLEQNLDKLLKGLSAEAGISFDRSFNFQDARTKAWQYEQISPILDGGGNVIDTTETIYGTNTTLAFSTSIPSQWRRMTFLGDLKYSKDWSDNQLSTVLLFQTDELVRNANSNTYRHLLAAGNVHYAKAGKYFADVSLSYNGTNLLPEESRFGFFPAVSVAWKLSNEGFLRGSSAVNNLKLRASYGLTGNDQVVQNINQNVFIGSASYYFQSNNTSFGGYEEGRLASHPLVFETSYKSNVGVDATFFDMLDLNFDAFYNKRKGILVETSGSVSSLLGVDLPYSSAGSTINKGVELGIKLYNNKSILKYNINGQLAWTKNEIVEMLEVYRPFDYLKRTGQPIGQTFGLIATGFFADDAEIAASPKQTFSIPRPGDIKYKDQNGDNIINDYDEVPIGYSDEVPQIYFSGALNLEFKGIGINALIQGTSNQTLFLSTTSVFWPLRSNTSISTFSENSWTPATAETASLPRLSLTENVNNYRRNTIWNVDGSYLKLRSVELYYSLPSQVISTMKVGEVKVYLRGMNLLSIDNVDYVDPEAIGTVYPTVSSWNLGIQIGF